MSEWEDVKLNDIIEIIGGGTPKTSIPEYWNGEIPWISVADFNNGRKYVSRTEKYITEEGLKSSSAKILYAGDIIISARGTVGLVAVLKKNMAFNQSCYGIKGLIGISETDYIYYLLIDTVENFLQIAHGGVFDTITRDTFKEILCLLPPLPEQKAIASVLSSLDDKIDLLHRQNKTLEAMAETLFRQWFIEEAGDDWEEKILSDFGKVICGKTPSKNNPDFYGGNVQFIKIPDMHGKIYIFETTDRLSEEGRLSQDNKTIPKNSICVSCIATVGLVALTSQDCLTNQQINSIIPDKEIYLFYLYFIMKGSYDLLHAMASGGTATLNLNTSDFKRISVSCPPDCLLEQFHKISSSFFEKIFKNSQQILTIEKLRDNLLPKLMSGEVRVNYE